MSREKTKESQYQEQVILREKKGLTRLGLTTNQVWNNESYSLYRQVPKSKSTEVMNNMGNFKKLGGNCYLG
jgi:hypothetical protein